MIIIIKLYYNNIMVKHDLKVKNSDLDDSTIDTYLELSSIYKLLLIDIKKNQTQFFKIYETYKRNHNKLGDLIYEASGKTGTDDWKKYPIKTKSFLIDSNITDEVDSKYIVPMISRAQTIKLSNKEVQKNIREMTNAYKGLKKILEKIQLETKKFTDFNNTLLYDIDSVNFIIKRKTHEQNVSL